MDIVSAFDTVWHPGLLWKLYNAGIQGRAWCWVKEFLTGRTLRVVHRNNSSSQYEIGAGVPQGSILGPLLFLIFINDIPVSRGVRLALFADDVAAWPILDGPAGDRALNRALFVIHLWAERWHVVFSLEKSASMVFTRKRTPISPLDIRLGFSPLVRVPKLAYLGITLTPSLTWHEHCNRIVSSAFHAAHSVSRIITTLGPSPRIIRQLVMVVVLPVITYGWPLWSPPTLQHWRKLESAICLPPRCALGLPSSTHRLSLLIEFGIPGPSLLHDCLSLAFAHRVHIQYPETCPSNPALATFLAQSETRLRRHHPKSLIPFAKLVKKVEIAWNIEHTNPRASSPCLLRPQALKHQIRAIQSLDPAVRPRYADLCLQPKPASYITSDSRPVAVLRARIRLNRHHLNSRQHLLALVPSSDCPNCLPSSVPEDPNHVLFHCPRFSLARFYCFAVFRFFNVPLAFDVISGDLSSVRGPARREIQAATAAFLLTINRARPI